MSSKNKKSKHKSKLSDDLPELKNDKKKKISFKDEIDCNNDDKPGSDNDEGHKKKHDSSRKSRRKHTKVSHKSKENNLNNIINDEKNEKGKKVRFSKIDVIDVECWKKLNLKMTAEENIDELIKITEGKKEKVKNVNCCIII